MTAARERKDEATLKNDPVVQSLIDQRQRLDRDINTPKVTVNFWSLNRSFMYHLLTKREPFYGMRIFGEQPIYTPYLLPRYADDPKMVEAISHVHSRGVPIIPIQIPTLAEMRKSEQQDFDYHASSVPTEQGKSLRTDFARLVGERTCHPRFFPARH
jgi:hypothetical protein